MTGWTWGPCGELNAGPHNGGDPQGAEPDQYLTPGANGWINVQVKVLVRCPNPLPVQFVVSYAQHGKIGTVQFPGFQDLGARPLLRLPGKLGAALRAARTVRRLGLGRRERCPRCG